MTEYQQFSKHQSLAFWLKPWQCASSDLPNATPYNRMNGLIGFSFLIKILTPVSRLLTPVSRPLRKIPYSEISAESEFGVSCWSRSGEQDD
jgi:hypothetical protein